jgi:hypothetical protein
MANDDPSQGDGGLDRQVEQLQAQVLANSAKIHALQAGADESAERAHFREDLADQDRQRIDVLEGQVDVDHKLILELQAEGLVNAELADHLLLALRSSRLIGAAIGIVMASWKVNEATAFEMLRLASQKANRKLRILADELVQTGDLADLHSVAARDEATADHS